MDACVDRIIQYFIQRGYIGQEDVPWTAYNLKRIIATAVGGTTFLILSYLIAGFWETLFFFGSFYLLRQYCNGYHSKTFAGCVLTSIWIELGTLVGLRQILTPIGGPVINAISVILILFMAPYDHPNMHYTQEELNALKNRIWMTVAALETIFIISHIFNWIAATAGLTMGLAMTAILLCLAYAAEWRKKNEQAQ